MNLLFLLLGLALTLAGANYLTDGCVALAKRCRIPEFIIGLTVIAIGTSMPELVVSTLSAIKGNSDMAVGNVIGSNLFNTYVIVGICALIAPLALTEGNIRRDIPLGAGASLVLLLVLSETWFHPDRPDRIDRVEGIIMLTIYAAIIVWSIRRSRREEVEMHMEKVSARPLDFSPAAGEEPVAGRVKLSELGPHRGVTAGWLVAVMILCGLAALIGGGELFIRGATAIAKHLGVSDTVIAITLVAGGTSLPELVTSAFAVAKGRPAMALGNVLGSNIANILLILGLSATIHPLAPAGITRADLAMILCGSLALYLAAFTFRKRAIDRWEGALLLTAYVAYICCLVAHQ